jgi:pimeloyl-ACP methyl ester carboxylesterase
MKRQTMSQTCAEAEFRGEGFGPQFLTVTSGSSIRRIAYLRRAPARPRSQLAGLVWLGGVKSHMFGVNASHLDHYAARTGRAFLRFDYSGHGLSEGVFEAGTIGKWLEESLAAIRELTDGPQILIGSSMGGWLALLAARALHENGECGRLKGLILLAPAVDFTEALIFEKMPASAKAELMQNGAWFRPSVHSSSGDLVTRLLIEEGRNHLLLGSAIRTYAPVLIMQGMEDKHVPWSHAMNLAEKITTDPVSLTLVKHGDHQLAREEDLVMLCAMIRTMDSGFFEDIPEARAHSRSPH